MKTKILSIAFILLGSSAYAQIMGYLTEFKTSEDKKTVAELSLIHRSHDNYKDIRNLGAQLVTIPSTIQGQKMKLERYRFAVMTGEPFTMDQTVYIEVRLFYDNETVDPRDDLHLISIPFPVETELVEAEIEHFGHGEIATAPFRTVPPGEPAYEKKEARWQKP